MPDGVPTSGTSALLTRVRRHLALIAGLTVAGLLLGMLVGSLQPKSYTAESRVFLSSQASFDALGGDFNTDASRYLDQQAGVMTSRPLLAQAVKLGAPADDVEQLQESVEVLASAESDVLTVRAVAADPEQATQRVDNVIAAFRDYQEKLVKAQLKAVESVSNAAEKRLAQQRAAVFGDGVQLVEDASVTASTSVLRNASVLALAGLLLGLALALARDVKRDARDQLARRRKRELLVAAGWPVPEDSDASRTDDTGFRTGTTPERNVFSPATPGNLPASENVGRPDGARSVEKLRGST